MRDKSSSIRLASSQFGDEHMSQAIAAKLRAAAHEAAQPVRPGTTVKQQLRDAWVALGRPAYWRVRSAFYGEGGSWSGAAFVDFMERLGALRARRAAHASSTHLFCAARHEAAAQALEAIDAETYREDIDRLRNLAHQLRNLAADGSLAERDT